MTVHYADDEVTVHHGDCLEVLAELPEDSVDAVVTDPPYGISFMGRQWDQPGQFGSNRGDGRPRGGHANSRGSHDAMAAGSYDLSPSAMRNFQQWCEAWSSECLRVLKPGAHLLSFGGSRTWHRLAAGIEDAGFEIRDSIAWLYGSGFPKSLNLGDGRGTALKPAFEPIVVGRKPLRGTVAANVAEHGTGAINIDACRIEAHDDQLAAKYASVQNAGPRDNAIYGRDNRDRAGSAPHDAGRWPTNVVLDAAQAAKLDAQTGVSVSRKGKPRAGANGDGWGMTATGAEYDDEGGASRFFPVFRYEAKASATERPTVNGVAHPTVKPLELMRWLVRLVTPPGGLVLDPFAGSGTTAEACIHEHMRCITIEREADYLPLIVTRLTQPLEVGFDFTA